MAQSKATKKSGRQNRNKQPESAHGKSASQREGDALDAQASSKGRESEVNWLPVLLHSPQGETAAAADRKPTPLALAPQRLPAVHGESGEPQPVAGKGARARNRKLSNVMYAALISGGLAAALIFSLGALKANRQEPQVALAGSTAASVAAPEPAPDSHVATKAASLEKGAATTAATGAGSRHTAGASKLAPAPHLAKKPGHARVEHAAHPVAEAKKKSATAITKAMKKPLEDHTEPLLAQNSAALASKSPVIQDRYAQCQEIGNFLRREQCKWQACNGKWGQDGCPSYSNDSRE